MDAFDPLNARPYRIHKISSHPEGSHARVIRMVGHDKRVLELGCGSGAMTEALAEQGCRVVAVDVQEAAAAFAAAHAERVVLADLDAVDLEEELAGEAFDVIVAADVVEHLKDPVRAVGSWVGLLDPRGSFVASIPNIAHAAVRLALLGGRFPYADSGLLDRTHLHMYTLESIRELLDGCALEITEVERVEKPVDRALVPVELGRLPQGILDWVQSQPEALTYQFIVRGTRRDDSRAPSRNAQRVTSRAATADEGLIAYQARALAAMDDAVQDLRQANAELTAKVARLTLAPSAVPASADPSVTGPRRRARVWSRIARRG